MTDTPIACTLSPSRLQAERNRLLPGVWARSIERLAVDDGYRARFAVEDDILVVLATMIDAERQCCQFLRLVVTVDPKDDAIWLEVTGPPGTREFLDGLLAQ